jgi:hypothetical protein
MESKLRQVAITKSYGMIGIDVVELIFSFPTNLKSPQEFRWKNYNQNINNCTTELNHGSRKWKHDPQKLAASTRIYVLKAVIEKLEENKEFGWELENRTKNLSSSLLSLSLFPSFHVELCLCHYIICTWYFNVWLDTLLGV